jgi:hypothetical protein
MATYRETNGFDGCALQQNQMPDFRFGSKADICTATDHVRFTLKSDRKSEHQLTQQFDELHKFDCFFLANAVAIIAVSLARRSATTGTVHPADPQPRTAGARQGLPVRFDLVHRGAA